MRSKKIILHNNLSPGDVVVSTAAIQCLAEQFPNRYLIDYRCSCPAVLENNPFITNLAKGEDIKLEYPLVNQSHLPFHFMQGYVDFLAERLKINLKLTTNRPHLFISDQEKAWKGRGEELFGRQPYIVVNAGYKDDYVTKKWLNVYWQDVVAALSERIQVIQVGSLDHNHTLIPGAIDQRGKTNHRELIRLLWHPDCVLVITGESYPAHLAAAFQKPCIVIASGFLPASWVAYPTTRIISVHGALPCCRYGACWRGKLFDKGNGNECSLPVLINDEPVAKCMQMVTPDKVITTAHEFLDVALGTIRL